MTHIDHEGMVLETVPAGIGLENDPDGKQVWSLMMQNIGIQHKFSVAGQIKPALTEFVCSYFITEQSIREIFHSHPFIPDGHEYYYIKGIKAGLDGDYLTACHLLIPQIENSLRFILKQRGEEPTGLHGDGTQERNGLKSLLENTHIIDVLGIDITTNIQALLLDKIYGNLRNQMSHGFIPAGQFFSHSAIYTWWLILHILMIPMAGYWKDNYQNEERS